MNKKEWKKKNSQKFSWFPSRCTLLMTSAIQFAVKTTHHVNPKWFTMASTATRHILGEHGPNKNTRTTHARHSSPLPQSLVIYIILLENIWSTVAGCRLPAADGELSRYTFFFLVQNRYRNFSADQLVNGHVVHALVGHTERNEKKKKCVWFYLYKLLSS